MLAGPAAANSQQNRGVWNCKPQYWRPNLITFQADEMGTGIVPDPFHRVADG